MANCPTCGEEITHTRVKANHPVFGNEPYHYCPFCGWTEEEGDNYKAPKKEGIQLRLEGM